ncbi:MAG: hypothetical protein LBO09_01265 [Candidatus Peribacteria bacterium]|jgi:hypothetical protein|nr:hypothetical protein [Candidatus Peribacteria bacterium]
MGVDAMYYDVRDFYLQDKEDYVRKTRAEVKQAILQHLHNKKEGNVSLNEKLGATGEDLKTKKIENLKQAYESLFFLEELDAHQGEYLNLREYKQSGKKEADYLAGLTDEQKQHFTEQKEKLNKKIALRMEYIENSLNEEKIVAGLKSSQGQKYLSDLLGQSAFYTERKEQGLRKEGEDNLALAKKELLEKIPETIKIRLDTIAQRDMHLLYELYQGAKYLSLETSTEKAEDSNEEGEKDFSQTQNNASYICTYVQALEL